MNLCPLISTELSISRTKHSVHALFHPIRFVGAKIVGPIFAGFCPLEVNKLSQSMFKEVALKVHYDQNLLSAHLRWWRHKTCCWRRRRNIRRTSERGNSCSERFPSRVSMATAGFGGCGDGLTLWRGRSLRLLLSLLLFWLLKENWEWRRHCSVVCHRTWKMTSTMNCFLLTHQRDTLYQPPTNENRCTWSTTWLSRNDIPWLRGREISSWTRPDFPDNEDPNSRELHVNKNKCQLILANKLFAWHSIVNGVSKDHCSGQSD